MVNVKYYDVDKNSRYIITFVNVIIKPSVGDFVMIDDETYKVKKVVLRYEKIDDLQIETLCVFVSK